MHPMQACQPIKGLDCPGALPEDQSNAAILQVRCLNIGGDKRAPTRPGDLV